MATTGVGSAFRDEAYRGVAYEAAIELYANDGTVQSPTQGDALDLSTWPFLQLLAHPQTKPGTLIAGEVRYTFAEPALLFVRIPWEAMEAAVEGNEGICPISFTVKAGQTDRSERTLLDGVLTLRPSGYTAA